MAKARIDEKALLDAALDEFSSYSYQEASINRIIKNAGISKGSFYYRFKTKFELYLYILKEGSLKKWDYIHKEMEGESVEGKDIFSQFLLQAELGLGFSAAFPRWNKLAGKFSREKGTEVYERVLKELAEDNLSGMDKMVDLAIAGGEFKKLYPRDFLISLFTFLFQNYYSIFPGGVSSDQEKLLGDMRLFTNFMMYGLKEEP